MPMVGILTAAVTSRRQLGRHALDHHGERPGLLDRLGVGEQLVRVALHLEAAELAHRLRRQADVAHHRDVGRGRSAAIGSRAADAAFELDRVSAAFLASAGRRFPAPAAG